MYGIGSMDNQTNSYPDYLGSHGERMTMYPKTVDKYRMTQQNIFNQDVFKIIDNQNKVFKVTSPDKFKEIVNQPGYTPLFDQTQDAPPSSIMQKESSNKSTKLKFEDMTQEKRDQFPSMFEAKSSVNLNPVIQHKSGIFGARSRSTIQSYHGSPMK